MHRIGPLFALFALSGFTGLIYESVWSHYLRLFLGAAAFSQSFVLAAFMGGMALGAWLASRWSARLSNLLGAYGWIEAAIGVAALVFHEVFILLTDLSLDRVIPALGSPAGVELYKYSLCALLIVPQTVLLGMTFPLLSGAVIRRSPQKSGHHLAMLYFTNSIGAAAGALVSAFLLLGWLGMPGTMRLAGIANLALAAAVLTLARRGEPAPVAAPGGMEGSAGTLARLFLTGAFVTGLASFIYEIAWIRMLSLVLGSSFHAFELMLSAFITGLALGGLWIRRRIDRIADPVRFAGLVQLFMGLAALATIFVYHWSFDWMAWALGALQRKDSAYPLFNLFSHALAFAVMLPATFLAGMTLPLFTHVLLRSGRGERAIGQVYAANTLGSIAGVLVAVHILVPGIGLKLTLIVGTIADMLLGAWLLRFSQAASRRIHALAAVAIGMLAAATTARADILNPVRLSSGVFRYGQAEPNFGRVVFYRDGKTASVAVRVQDSTGLVTINTNGKPDAGLRLDLRQQPIPDEYTMGLLAALPLLIKPEAKTFANIGWGSGMSAHALLSHTGPQTLDNIEIEPAMYDGARAFGGRVFRAYKDPRSHIWFEDAKSYFARHGKRYDVILAEPSNPWVAGVASLFTTEFYHDAKRYLAPGGLFVQWMQGYEFNDALLASVLAALGENFSDYEIYESNAGDILIAAVVEGRVPRTGVLPPKQTAFLEELGRLGITRTEEISARSLGHKKYLEPLVTALASQPNSDFHPVVQLEAPKARFAGTTARAIQSLAAAPVPVTQMLSGTPISFLAEPAPAFDPSVLVRAQSTALEIVRLASDRNANLLSQDRIAAGIALVLRNSAVLCGDAPSRYAIDQLQAAAEITIGSLPLERIRALWVERRWLACQPRSDEVRERLDVYAVVATHDAKAMLARGRRLLEGPPRGGDDWGRYLLSVAMLGAVAGGEHAQAVELWSRYSRAFYPRGDAPVQAVYLLNRR